jgi:hypothetical protein
MGKISNFLQWFHNWQAYMLLKWRHVQALHILYAINLLWKHRSQLSKVFKISAVLKPSYHENWKLQYFLLKFVELSWNLISVSVAVTQVEEYGKYNSASSILTTSDNWLKLFESLLLEFSAWFGIKKQYLVPTCSCWEFLTKKSLVQMGLHVPIENYYDLFLLRISHKKWLVSIRCHL